MKFKIWNVINDYSDYDSDKVGELYKQVLNKYDYEEDDKYSYITIKTLDELMQLEKEVNSLSKLERGIIIKENTIIIYDDYIE